MTENHAEITRNAKPQVKKSRAKSTKTNHAVNHETHASDKTAGQEITQQITEITDPEITPTTAPEGGRVAVSAPIVDSTSTTGDVETIALAMGFCALVIRRGDYVPPAPPTAVDVDPEPAFRPRSRRAQQWPRKYRQRAPHPGSEE